MLINMDVIELKKFAFSISDFRYLKPMERKVFLCQNMIMVMLLLGQLHGYTSCIKKERKALFELKRYVISIAEEGESDFILSNWRTNDTKSDCCRWEGVKCNRTSRRVIGLSLGQPFFLEHSLLNLSLLHPFEEVRNLDLSASRFTGLFDEVEGYKSLKRLRNLEILDLSINGFNNSIFPFLNAATSLKKLFLIGNKMDDLVSVQELKDLTNLELLDLSENNFNGSIQVQELSVLRNLKALSLRENEFSGAIGMAGICQLKNLQELDLSRNKLVGQFPLCLTSLTGLQVLDFSSNQMSGKLPSALGNLESLSYISLIDNNFNGFFSLGWLANLSKLIGFKLDSKSNSLQVESDGFWKPEFQLNVISLRSCNLGKVPHFLLHQKDLRQVDLANNKMVGNFPSWLLANNTKLEALFLQNNSLASFEVPKSSHNLLYLDVSMNGFSDLLPENIGWILPHLLHMNLAQNNFHGDLPSSLGNMEKIEFLDISHNGFSGKLPRSIVDGCYSLIGFKLSHNKLTGEIFPESTKFIEILLLTMDNNQFTGSIGQSLRSLGNLNMLDISNNNLTGVIPGWIGELQGLEALVLSNNLLEGEIPISLFNISSLRLLDLSANMLSGGIPTHVNSAWMPVVLLLQDNILSGVLPDTLLLDVAILDLRNNRFSGKIPEFINTQNITILLLRGNNLTGRIPDRLCGLSNVHLLDLANNRLSGSIPSCLSNISFGLGNEDASDNYDISVGVIQGEGLSDPNPIHTENMGIYFKSQLVTDPFTLDYYAESRTEIKFATKHRYDSYMGGNLLNFSGLDLSENELSGEIPVELGSLLKLHSLNLSHNHLLGEIPGNFSGMKNMESLDLSFNRLHGQIPPELTELGSLAIFNVSYNNLSGVIPQGRQFNTFDMLSYLGNPLLCGQPTNISCNGNSIQEPENNNEVEDDESTIDMVSLYWSFIVAYVTILLGILASLSFDSRWSRAWFNIVDAFTYNVRHLLC